VAQGRRNLEVDRWHINGEGGLLLPVIKTKVVGSRKDVKEK
jgi:hypothetical protein